MDELERDTDGDVVMRPLIGWKTISIAGVAVLVSVQFIENEEELELGTHHQLQLVLKPEQCIEFADGLTRAARVLMAGTINPDAPVN